MTMSGKQKGQITKIETNRFSPTSLNDLINKAQLFVTFEEGDDLLTQLWQLHFNATPEEIALLHKTDFHIKIMQSIFLNEKLSKSIVKAANDREQLIRVVMSDENFLKIFRSTTKQRDNLIAKQIIFESKNAGPDFVQNMSFIKQAIEIAFFPLLTVIDVANPTEVKNSLKEFLRKMPLGTAHFEIQRIALSCSEILMESEYNHEIKFTEFTDLKLFFPHLKKAAILGKTLLTLSVQVEVASECFIKSSISLPEGQTADLKSLLRKIYNVTHISDRAFTILESSLKDDAQTLSSIRRFLDEYVFANEIILMKTLQCISKGFHTASFTENLLTRIATANEDWEKLNQFIRPKLQAFSEKREGKSEWANKIYLNAVKLLAVFSSINESFDTKWKISVAVRELYIWIQETHEIINQSILADDWAELSPFLSSAIEDDKIEWKSSFYIPLEGDGKQMKVKALLEAIGDSIIAFMNTEGGTIIVGVVENPKNVNKSYNKYLFKKSDHTFFNISEEFKLLKISLDDIRRNLQQEIANLSGTTTGKFDNYWSIKPQTIFCHDTKVSIFRINVKKAEEPFLSKSGEKIFIRKRIQGGNRDVDPRQEFDFQLKIDFMKISKDF